MDQMMELFKIGGFSIVIMFMSMILKQAGKDVYANIVSIGGVVVILIVVCSYIIQLFEVAQTMLTF